MSTAPFTIVLHPSRLGFSCLALLLALLAAGCSSDEGGPGPEDNTWGLGEDAGQDLSVDGARDMGGDDGARGCVAPAEPLGSCDPVCGTGCSGGATVCQGTLDRVSGGTVFACTAAGDRGAGQRCDHERRCEEGLHCLRPEGREHGVCSPLCRLDGGDGGCAEERDCMVYEGGGGEYGVCAEPDCTPFPMDDCPQGQNCYEVRDGWRCLSYEPSAMLGDRCEDAIQCNDQQDCISSLTDPDSSCHAKCELGRAEEYCEGDEICVAPTNRSFGVCRSLAGGG